MVDVVRLLPEHVQTEEIGRQRDFAEFRDTEVTRNSGRPQKCQNPISRVVFEV